MPAIFLIVFLTKPVLCIFASELKRGTHDPWIYSPDRTESLKKSCHPGNVGSFKIEYPVLSHTHSDHMIHQHKHTPAIFPLFGGTSVQVYGSRTRVSEHRCSMESGSEIQSKYFCPAFIFKASVESFKEGPEFFQAGILFQRKFQIPDKTNPTVNCFYFNNVWDNLFF